MDETTKIFYFFLFLSFVHFIFPFVNWIDGVLHHSNDELFQTVHVRERCISVRMWFSFFLSPSHFFTVERCYEWFTLTFAQHLYVTCKNKKAFFKSSDENRRKEAMRSIVIWRISSSTESRHHCVCLQIVRILFNWILRSNNKKKNVCYYIRWISFRLNKNIFELKRRKKKFILKLPDVGMHRALWMCSKSSKMCSQHASANHLRCTKSVVLHIV